MLKGLYTAASGMLAQQRRQEVLSNNLANANTNGYKADQGQLRAFPEMLLKSMESKQTSADNSRYVTTSKEIGSINSGVYVQETIPNFVQGDLRETGISTDTALVDGTYPDENGSVFFNLQTADGEAYTRNGNFTVDEEGFLTNDQGSYVLDTTGNPIQTNNQTYTMSADGSMQFTDGRNIQLGLTYVQDANLLDKQGENVYTASDEAQAADARATAGVTYNIVQGAVEGSNVDLQQTMADMMQAYRTFESNQKVLTAYDESLGKAVNEVGKL
ncbi:flagellar hook-basal body protein [Terribacillus saccharophilus]|uniref:Flagellar basal body rod protein FlgC n=1 Tax=Terribacillus saccharophilus TaxID=361277 RepID=A0A075LTY6_9BACI|nr:flagellar hook-basal body protein [Terribacillus goriensis]AIF67888.1 flagellar basal body rod protein FlgC [Terribacillus goriensis]MEC0302173.1 flagellar hook-basal body protein [Terribacillus saccharophilus]